MCWNFIINPFAHIYADSGVSGVVLFILRGKSKHVEALLLSKVAFIDQSSEQYVESRPGGFNTMQ